MRRPAGAHYRRRPEPLEAEVFRARCAELLEELAGDEVRLVLGLWDWWRRVSAGRSDRKDE